MGASLSKEELLYQEVKKGNHDAVKAYRRDGASLEWIDKKGRSPLILACTRHNLMDMAITLLHLGANINVYRPGSHGGFPLHHAARKGLEKTVTLLLSHGADPFAVNDGGHTPLEVARSRGHASVVRLLEDRVAIFSGMLRELSGPEILESVVPKLCMKKIWAVVIPINSPGRTQKYELALYTSPKINIWTGIYPSSHPAGICNVARTRAIIQLSKTELGDPEFTSADPILYIVDKDTKVQHKFLSEKEGDRAQLEKFYKACKGIPLVQSGPVTASSAVLRSPSTADVHGNACQIHPQSSQRSDRLSPAENFDLFHSLATLKHFGPYNFTTTETVPDNVELALALDASICSAAEQRLKFSPSSPDSSFRDYTWGEDIDRCCSRWTSAEFNTHQIWELSEVGTSVSHSSYSSPDVQPVGLQISSMFEHQPSLQQLLQMFDHRTKLSKLAHIQASSKTYVDLPSAPPLPQAPAIDTVVPTLLEIESSSSFEKTQTEKVNGTCVLCWDALAEGVCVPCGHMVSCMNCLSEINKNDLGCPICRTPIQQAIKVYAV